MDNTVSQLKGDPWVVFYHLRFLDSVLCRQVMKNIDDMPSVITINDTVQIRVSGEEDVDVAIVSHNSQAMNQ